MPKHVAVGTLAIHAASSRLQANLQFKSTFGHSSCAPAATQSALDANFPSAARLQIVPNFRVRTIPVLGTTPALFGMAAAGYVLCALAGGSHAIEGEPIIRLNCVQYERALERLRERERSRWARRASS